MERVALICVSWTLTGMLARVGAAEPQLVARSGVRGGLIVHVGCGDGKLTAALRVNERYVVHGLTTDRVGITKARAHVRSQGIYGPVWVDTTRSPGRNVAWVTSPYSCVGLDPRAGKQVRSIAVENLLSPGHHPRCYRAKATERYILQRKRGIEFIDLAGENHQRHDWLRAPCRHGFVPANGLIYMPPHQCFCYPGTKLTGFNALAAGGTEVRSQRSEVRLERGAAYAAVISDQSSVTSGRTPQLITDHRSLTTEEWPTFRHDPRRSGGVATEIPAKLQRLWSAELGMDITPPVVASGRLYVAAKDAHAIHCLDAETGRRLWDYMAGGRIDSPPTVHADLVLFGCTDGNVYCLRARDGALAWRFLAAPNRRRIMAFDQLESPWPVHGSVLVQNGLAYATAGRSSYLDGGISAYALRPETGEIVHSTVITSPEPDLSADPGRPFDVDGTRTDVLVSDVYSSPAIAADGTIYMGGGNFLYAFGEE